MYQTNKSNDNWKKQNLLYKMHKKSKVSCQIKHFTKKEKHCIVMFVNIIMNFENK